MSQSDWEKLRNSLEPIKHKFIVAYKPDYSVSIMTGETQGIEPMGKYDHQAYLDEQARILKQEEIDKFKENLENKLPNKQPRTGNKLKI